MNNSGILLLKNFNNLTNHCWHHTTKLVLSFSEAVVIINLKFGNFSLYKIIYIYFIKSYLKKNKKILKNN